MKHDFSPTITLLLALLVAWGVFVLIVLGVKAFALEHVEESPIEQAFDEAADTYDLDADILRAIARAESGCGTSPLAKNRNNLFGWMANSGEYMAFDSPEACIWHVARVMAGRPHETVEDIAGWYNPNPAWIELVRGCMG